MNAQQMETDKLDEQTLVELDAYSSDGQYIGTVKGFLAAEPENEQASETGVFDVIGSDGRLQNGRRVVIDGIGTFVQSRLAVPVDQLTIDLKGRRVTVPLSLAEIESLVQQSGD